MRRQVWQTFHSRSLPVPDEVRVQLRLESKQLKAVRLEERTSYQRSLQRELAHANFTGNYRRVWQLVRLLAGTFQGPKRRVYGSVSLHRPTLQDWKTYLAQPGPEGGCKASVAQEVVDGAIDVEALAMAAAESYHADRLPFTYKTEGRWELFFDVLDDPKVFLRGQW